MMRDFEKISDKKKNLFRAQQFKKLFYNFSSCEDFPKILYEK
jgi:hypothetical protein